MSTKLKLRRRGAAAGRIEQLPEDVVATTSGVAKMLWLKEDVLLREVVKLGGCFAADNCAERDERSAVRNVVRRIIEVLSDHNAWDEYSASPGPSAYRFAAAVVLWLLLSRYHHGGYIRLDCPAFSEGVAAAVAQFLATRYAVPIAEAIRQAVGSTKPRDVASRCVA